MVDAAIGNTHFGHVINLTHSGFCLPLIFFSLPIFRTWRFFCSCCLFSGSFARILLAFSLSVCPVLSFLSFLLVGFPFLVMVSV